MGQNKLCSFSHSTSQKRKSTRIVSNVEKAAENIFKQKLVKILPTSLKQKSYATQSRLTEIGR
jgi:hypothetical protein